MIEFKVGDKVRHNGTGKTGRLETIRYVVIGEDGHEFVCCRPDNLELVEPSTKCPSCSNTEGNSYTNQGRTLSCVRCGWTWEVGKEAEPEPSVKVGTWEGNGTWLCDCAAFPVNSMSDKSCRHCGYIRPPEPEEKPVITGETKEPEPDSPDFIRAAFTDDIWPQEWQMPEGWSLTFHEEGGNTRQKPLLCAELKWLTDDMKVHAFYDRGWHLSSVWVSHEGDQHIGNPVFLEGLLAILTSLKAWGLLDAENNRRGLR